MARELYCLKACRISKVHARSHEITKELFTSSNYENTDKKSHDVETNISDVEKSKNRSKQNFAWDSYNSVNAVFCEESLGKTQKNISIVFGTGWPANYIA